MEPSLTAWEWKGLIQHAPDEETALLSDFLVAMLEGEIRDEDISAMLEACQTKATVDERLANL